MLIVRQARVSGVVPAALGTPSEVTIEVSRGDTTATFSLPFAPGDAAGTDPESGKASSGPPSRRGYVPPERRSGWLQTAVVL